MTQRLSGISDADATGVAKDTLAGSTKLLGRSSNLLRILSAHTPYLARWFIGFVAAVRQPNVGAVSDVRLRNLATIKTSMTNECKYCATHTSIYGQALGVSEARQPVIQRAREGDHRLGRSGDTQHREKRQGAVGHHEAPVQRRRDC
jgi:alkylhydroperoxidase family enzyme